MDQLFTERMQGFLDLDKPTDEQVREGAKLLLQLSPAQYRGLYNSTQKRPQSLLPWIRKELKKHLDIRRRGLVREQVEAYNREAVTRVRETLSVAPEPETAQMGPVPVLGTKGKRADHDSLPENIRQIWDDNIERWKQMRKYHIQLGRMIASPGYTACDGNELCYQLRQLDDKIRKEYARYDAYAIRTAGEKKEDRDSVDVFTDNVKTVQNARTAITRGLARQSHNDEQLQKLQQAVDTLYALGQQVKTETAERLKALGISVPSSDNNNP